MLISEIQYSLFTDCVKIHSGRNQTFVAYFKIIQKFVQEKLF